MSTIPTNSQYQQTLYKTLPDGIIWPPFNESSNVRSFVDWVAYNARQQQLDTCNVLDYSYPDSTQYISDWERILGLPKSKLVYSSFIADVGEAGDTLGSVVLSSALPADVNIRVSQVLSFFNRTGLNNAQAYIDMGEVFNVTVSDVTTTEPFKIQITISAGDSDNIESFEDFANFFKPCYCVLTFVTT